MWSKPVTLALVHLWLLIATNFRSTSAAQDATHEDIRTAIYSFARTLRDNVEKLERHERRELQSGDQMQNMLLTIVNKQREQYADDKALEAAVKGLEQTLAALTTDEAEESIDIANVKSKLDGLESMLKGDQAISSNAYRSLDGKMNVMMERMDELRARLDGMERASADSRTGRPDQAEILELLKTIVENGKAAATVPAPAGCGNGTLQLVQETGHRVTDAIRALSDRMDAAEQRHEAFEAGVRAAAAAEKEFREDVKSTLPVMTNEVMKLSNLESMAQRTEDSVQDTKRRIEYGTHQIVMELTAAAGDRARELNGSVEAVADRGTRTVLESLAGVSANLSVKIETEISQVWRQIGVMYQTLTDSASKLDRLQRQTDAFVNGTRTSLDGMDGRVSAIAGRMTEVDENLNYLLGRLSLVTQEFKEIKVGLGDALDSIRVGLQTVQGANGTVGVAAPAADLGPGPNPIVDESSENMDLDVLTKTVYTVT